MTGKPRNEPRPAKLVAQKHGGAIKQGGVNPGGGRPPDAFKAMCQQLASSQDVKDNVEKILKDPALHANLYIGALKWATEHGYGKPKESVEVTGKDGGALVVKFVREDRKRTAG